MKKLYLTPTLLNSWQYYINSKDDQEDKAKEDFFNCLNKIKTDPTPKMLRGCRFERDVWDFSNGKILTDDKTIVEIAQIIKGGLWQESVQKELLTFFGYTIFLYGILDILKQNTIYDIKRVDKYKVGKYLKSYQHLIYLYCTNADCFKYLISDGLEVYKEDYCASNLNEHKLITGVLDFLNWLKANDLFEIYANKWKFDLKKE